MSKYPSASKPGYVVDSIHQIAHSYYAPAREPHIIATRIITTHAHHDVATLGESGDFSKADVVKNDFPTAVNKARLSCDRSTTYNICADNPIPTACYYYDLGVLPAENPDPHDDVDLYIRAADTRGDDVSGWDDIDWDYCGHIDDAYDKYC